MFIITKKIILSKNNNFLVTIHDDYNIQNTINNNLNFLQKSENL